MARKREPLEPDAGQRLLQSKLKLLQGLGARRHSLALDILTGRTVAPVAEPDETEVEAQIQQNGGLPAHTDEPLTSAGPLPPPPSAPGSTTPLDGRTLPGQAAPGSRQYRPADRRTLVARTVYLSAEDLQDIDFVVRAWRRRLHRRVSRSEVLRQAIGNLRDAVELGAAPRNPGASTRREEADHQHG